MTVTPMIEPEVDEHELARMGKTYWEEVSKGKSWSSRVILERTCLGPVVRAPDRPDTRLPVWRVVGSGLTEGEAREIHMATFVFEFRIDSWIRKELARQQGVGPKTKPAVVIVAPEQSPPNGG